MKASIYSYKKILIRAPDWIGDLVMAIPAIKTIRKNYLQSYISALCPSSSKPLLDDCPYLDEVLEYNVSDSLEKQVKLIKFLRKKNFDLAVLLSGSFNAAIISFLAGIKERVGLDSDNRGFLLTKKMKKDTTSQHQIENYLEVAKLIGIKNCDRRLELWLSEEGKNFCRKFWEKNELGSKEIIVGISPFVRTQDRTWPLENFALLIEKLGKISRSFRILVFGSQKEMKKGQKLQSLTRKNFINLIGQTTLKEAIALIAKCHLFVGNDSGLSHIASALNVKTFVIFGPSNLIMARPAGKNSFVIRKEKNCMPCSRRKRQRCGEKCLREIKVEEVLEKILYHFNLDR
jgi:heptosyltransferase-2